jgi:hypothetical protein
MDLYSIFLAKFWGLYLILVSLGLLFNRHNLKMVLHYYKDEEVPFLSGFILVVFGLLFVLTHNVWSFDWVGLVTLLGWLTLIKGIVRIWWPKETVRLMKGVKGTPTVTISLYVALIAGLYLAGSGFNLL